MKKYIISGIYADGYERFVEVEEKERDAKFIVHFLEYDEFLENGGTSKKKKVGDVLEGEVFVDLVTFNEKVTKELMHQQKIPKASHIEAIVEVAQIIDEYSLYAYSTILDDKILIEFEKAVDYKIRDRIFLEGSLEMNGIEAE